MLENLFMFLILLALVLGNWLMLCYLADGRQWQPIPKNIRLFRSFKPKHKFLKIYIAGQRKRGLYKIGSGELNTIGLAGALISTIAAVFIIPLAAYYYICGSHTIAIGVLILWIAFTLETV